MEGGSVEQGLRGQIALWKVRAAEARALAEEMPSTQAKAVFEEIALSYQKMADSAEADLRMPEVPEERSQLWERFKRFRRTPGTRKTVSRSE
jgi:hypothetical protein